MRLRKRYYRLRRASLTALALALAATTWAAPLRVTTFNVKLGLGAPGTSGFESTAAVLGRVGADVVTMQELVNDSGNLSAMGSRLGLPHIAYQPSNAMGVGLLSKYPLYAPVWIFHNGMTRPILLVQVDVPNVLRDPWIAVVHLKCCNTSGSEQYTRAVELHFLRREIALRTTLQDPVVVMGDFNLVAPNDITYATGPEGVSPFSAPAGADGYFIPQGIFKLDARHAGSGGEDWTWRSNGQFPSGALDHIMVNATVRERGTAVEIYNAEKDAEGITGLNKRGAPLSASFAFVSDHLPVFADLDLEDGNANSAVLAVDAASGLSAEGPVGGPFTPATGTYILRNTGSQTLEWAAEYVAPWLTLSINGGMIDPGASVTITASPNAAAASLGVGTHTQLLRFVNKSNGLGTTLVPASVFVGSFSMDGTPDSPGYTVDSSDMTLRVAVRGTRLYVATQSAGYGEAAGRDHHLLITDQLLPSATSPAPWAKRGLTALPEGRPFLAAEGANSYAGWFNAANSARLRKARNNTGVLEGSIDLVEQFGAVPDFIYVAAVAFETANASPSDISLGRVLSQVPRATIADDDITPDEFLKVPVRSITDSAADGRFDVLVPGRGFAAEFSLSLPEEQPVLRWKTVPGYSYRLWRSSELATGWEDAGTHLASPGEWEALVPDTRGGSNRRFFRVELIEQEN